MAEVDVCVIGAGISGLATAKCMQDAGFKVTVLERTDDVGGLWVFRERGYGVMRFTHINVSKQNYCFSDYPFPDEVPDFPHNEQMASYIRDYTRHFGLYKLIEFNTEVSSLERKGDTWEVIRRKLKKDDEGDLVRDGEEETTVRCKYVAIATGHHAKPTWPNFTGQDNFKGEVIHSVDFNDAITNGYVGKRVLIVGIGNSAVDAAVNCVNAGCKEVHLSSRSGAWVLPNYVLGCPTDHYSSRLLLWLPWKFTNFVLETITTLMQGHPYKWGLNPRMKALQTQPTVCPTLIFHIQRGQVKMHPNIDRMEGKKVYFDDGKHIEVDAVVFCTGYAIDIPYLADDVKKECIKDGNRLELFKNVFSPTIGSSLAFIGFVQPASGGVLSMSETQARWWAEICKGKVQLPSKDAMSKVINAELVESSKRYYSSARHTIQKDPILYNDDIASRFGAKPQFWKHPSLAWRLLVGTCGAAQYRLQGPGRWDKAAEVVRGVPVTPLIDHSLKVVLFLVISLTTLLIFSIC